ncbi:MAG: hypothetical protein CL535_08815 [Ahrensia sp.]|nr:hypothetical protein [Ahrensia sp.]
MVRRLTGRLCPGENADRRLFIIGDRCELHDSAFRFLPGNSHEIVLLIVATDRCAGPFSTHIAVFSRKSPRAGITFITKYY